MSTEDLAKLWRKGRRIDETEPEQSEARKGQVLTILGRRRLKNLDREVRDAQLEN